MAGVALDMAQARVGLRPIKQIFPLEITAFGPTCENLFESDINVSLRTILRAQVARTRGELLNSVCMTDRPSGQHVSS